MKTLHVLALVPLVVSCHFDKLFSGSGNGSPLSHGTPRSLAFSTRPGPAQAGQRLDPVRVAVVDSAGTRVAGADSLITIVLTDNPDGATLSGTGNVRAANGVATFVDLSIDKPRNGYTLTASGTGLIGATSDPFNVMPPPTTTGDLTVTTTTTGASPDQNGYTVTVDGATSKPILTSGSVTFTALASGNHTVDLSDIAANCTVSNGTSRPVNVPAGGTHTESFSISCPTPPPTTGDLTVTTTTGGTGTLDPDGYTVTVDGASRPIGINNSVTFGGLPAGDRSVSLTGVAGNCVVSGQNPRTINVPAGGSNQTNFAVTCDAPANQAPIVDAGPDQPMLVAVLFTLTASFSDPDHNGPWSFTIDWADGPNSTGNAPSEGTIGGSHTYLLPGIYHIRVTVRDSAGGTGSDEMVLTVSL